MQSGSDTEGSLKDFIVPDSDVEGDTPKLVFSLNYSSCNSQLFSRKTVLRREPVPSQDDSDENSDGLSAYERCVFIFFKVFGLNLSRVSIGSSRRQSPKPRVKKN